MHKNHVSMFPEQSLMDYMKRILGLKFVTSCNPILPNISSFINKYFAILHADLNFSKKSYHYSFRRQKNLKEMFTLSPYSKYVNSYVKVITPCNICDI